MRIGILSDTHGLLRPEVLARLAGCDHLLHAGDVGDAAILDELREIAPVTAILGNTDPGTSAAHLPPQVAFELAGLPMGMVHRREDIPSEWLRCRRLVVFGHTHRPELEWRGDCLLLNPGACGARRFRLPLTVAVVTLLPERLIPEILSVEPA